MTRLNKDLVIGNSNTRLESLIPYVLYNTTNPTDGTVTLSDSAANYKYLDIYFQCNDGYTNYVRVYEPDQKTVSLLSAYVNPSTNAMIFKADLRFINGIWIASNVSGEGYMNVEVVGFNSIYTRMYIYRVIGYK